MPLSASTSLAGLTIRLHIDKGKDLVAKDKNWRGKKTTSDPFIRIYVDGVKVGYTRTIKKTVDPVWDQTLEFNFSADQVMKIVRNNKPIELKIFDKDVLSFSDPMGTVEIPLDLRSSEALWYSVGSGKGTSRCDNATGELLVAAEIKAIKYLELQPGLKHQLEKPNLRFGIAWDTKLDGGWRGGKDLDVACVAVQNDGTVDLRQCVYYANLRSSDGSMQHSGDCLSGRSHGDNEQISVNLQCLPTRVVALYFVLSVASPDETLASVAGTEIRVIDASTGIGISRYQQNDWNDGTEYTSAYMIRAHREPTDGRWYLRAMDGGDELAHDFGTIIPQIKAYTRDIVPSMPLDPHGRLAIMRKEGCSIRIKDYVRRFPSNISFGLSWDFTPQPRPIAVNDEDIQEVEDDPNGAGERGIDGDDGDKGEEEEPLPMDLDASVICLDRNHELVEVISKRKLESECFAIRHGGDEVDGTKTGDDESIRIFLYELNPSIKELIFVVNSFNGQPLDSVQAASCRIFSAGDDRKEIATYKIENNHDLSGRTAFLLASLYNPSDDDEEGWCLRILSDAADGTVAEDNVGDAQQYLERNPFVEAPELPELTDELLEGCTMPPEPKPLDEDPEIVFLGGVM